MFSNFSFREPNKERGQRQKESGPNHGPIPSPRPSSLQKEGDQSTSFHYDFVTFKPRKSYIGVLVHNYPPPMTSSLASTANLISRLFVSGAPCGITQHKH